MIIRVEDLRMPAGSFVLEGSAVFSARTTAIFGPSGAGKTTLLETIAGLRRPAGGRITIGDDVVFDGGRESPARDRRLGYVTQDDTLFPHMTVRQNAFYGAGEGNAADAQHVIEVLEIGPLLDRRTGALSGGERRRVAIARALLRAPRVLLLDEPLSGVDGAMRQRVLEYLIRVREEFPLPILYVTHETAEVQRFCDEVLPVEGGRIGSIRNVQEWWETLS